MVYTMAKTVAANIEHGRGEQGDGGLTPKDMAADIGVPFHKGAVEVLQGSRGDVRRPQHCSDNGAAQAAPFHIQPGNVMVARSRPSSRKKSRPPHRRRRR